MGGGKSQQTDVKAKAWPDFPACTACASRPPVRFQHPAIVARLSSPALREFFATMPKVCDGSRSEVEVWWLEDISQIAIRGNLW